MKEIIRFEPDLINIIGLSSYEAVDVAVISRWKLAVVFLERPDQIWFLDLNSIKQQEKVSDSKWFDHLHFDDIPKDYITSFDKQLNIKANVYKPPLALPVLKAQRVMYFEDSIDEFEVKDGLLLVRTCTKDLFVYSE